MKNVKSDAVLSEDGLYRYQLTRTWDESRPLLAWIMLNPSTANATANDPTVRECISHAQRWNYGGIIICNLFAFRASKPVDMMNATDPVGPENDWYISNMVTHHDTVVLAWGAKGGFKNRAERVLSLPELVVVNKRLKCLGKSAKGHPYHPLGTIGPVHLRDFYDV